MNIVKKYNLTDRDKDRIIGMAWEDRTPFDAIKEQFGLPEGDVIKLMRQSLHINNWKKWRARVQGRATKHRELRNTDVERFKATRQKQISSNRIAKR